MKKFRYILVCLIGLLLVSISSEALAQRADSPLNDVNAITLRYQKGDWSMPRFAEGTPLKSRFYITTGVGVLSSGNEYGSDIRDFSNIMFKVGGGFRFTPVHSVELTANLENRDMSYTLGYYMNLNNIVLNSDSRSRVEVSWGAALDYATKVPTHLGLATSLRMQYNLFNNLGLYLEPRLAVYKASTVGGYNFNNVPSINFGATYKFGDPDVDTFNIFLPIVIKSNLLYDLAMTPNIGVEVPLGNRYSVSVDLMRGWWLKRDNSFAWQLQAYDVEGRYWFGNRTKRDKLQGWFGGVFLSAGYYDFQFKENYGVQGEFYLLTGVGVGYAMPISKRFGLEYELGAGYIVSDYQKYEVVENKYLVKCDYKKRLEMLTPIKAKVSLTYKLFNKM